MKEIKYEETTIFSKEFKTLKKKYRSLDDDITIMKSFNIEILHIQKQNNRSIIEIQGAGNNEDIKFYKVKKFVCRSLKSKGVNSGIRITYAFFPKENKVVFLEIYLKSKKPNEDRERIKEFLKTLN